MQKPRLVKQIVDACQNVSERVRLVAPWNKNYVVTVLDFACVTGQSRFHLSANTVTRYRLAVLFTYGEAKFALLGIGMAVEHDEIFVGDAVRVLVNVAVLIVLFKSVRRLQS